MENKQDIKSAIAEHQADIDNNPALYVGTYGKYNGGSIAGAWLDLSTFADPDEFLEFCADVLHGDEEDPELMFQDYMNFPESMYSESACAEDLQPIWDWMDLDEDDRDAVQEYWDEVDSHADPQDIIDKIVYRGEFRDFADNMADEMMACNGCNDNFLSRYFDYESFARDLKYDYYVTDNYVFETR